MYVFKDDKYTNAQNLENTSRNEYIWTHYERCCNSTSHLWGKTLSSCQKWNKPQYKPSYMHAHTKKHELWLSGQKHEGHPVGVRGVFLHWFHTDVDKWSVKTMSHSCPAPFYTGEGHCVWGKSGRQRLSPHMLLMVPERVQLCAHTAECVVFWQPMVSQVDGMAEALHVSAVWGQGVSEMAESTGLNTLTSAKPWEAPFYFNGKNPWSVSDSNLSPNVSHFHTQHRKHTTDASGNWHFDTVWIGLWAWLNQMSFLFFFEHATFSDQNSATVITSVHFHCSTFLVDVSSSHFTKGNGYF